MITDVVLLKSIYYRSYEDINYEFINQLSIIGLIATIMIIISLVSSIIIFSYYKHLIKNKTFCENDINREMTIKLFLIIAAMASVFQFMCVSFWIFLRIIFS